MVGRSKTPFGIYRGATGSKWKPRSWRQIFKAFLRLIPPKGHISEGYLNVQSEKFKLDKERGFKIKMRRGRLDIILEDGEHAIVIENKIDAEDQEGQLRKYYEYAKDSFEDHELIYLTKYGDEPSEVSLRDIKAENKKGEEAAQKEVRKNCICMSYKYDIIPWLTKCTGIASELSLARVGETIKQYIYLIEQLTNSTMEDKELDNIAEIAVKHPGSTLALLEAQDNGKISYVFVKRFIFEPLRNEFKSEFDVEIGKYDNSSYYIKLSKKEWKHGYINIVSNNATSWKDVFISVVHEKKRGKKLSPLPKSQNKYNPYGWEWICGGGDEKKGGPGSDWDSLSSFDDMINEKKILKWLIGKINDIRDELVKRDDIKM